MCLSILTSKELSPDAKAKLKSVYDAALSRLQQMPGLSRADYDADSIAAAVLDCEPDSADFARHVEDVVFRVVRAVPTTATP